MKILITEKQYQSIIIENINGYELLDKKYTPRYDNNKIIFLDPDKLLTQHTIDDPDFAIINKKNQIGNRVEKAKEFLLKYLHDDSWEHPVSKKRSPSTKVTFEPSIAHIYDDKLSFTDGRHRILAAKELGLKLVPVEVPKDQVELFKTKFL